MKHSEWQIKDFGAKSLPAWVKLPSDRLKQQYLLSTGENMYGSLVDLRVTMFGRKEIIF